MADSLLTLDIEKPAAGGRMLARLNGQIVLVWGAIPGERVRARVERSGKGVLFAETVDVLSASPDRRDALGDWRCGGNVLAHVTYARQLHVKSEIIRDAFAPIGRIPLEVAENIPANERACHLELEPGNNARAFAVLATDAVTGLSAHVLDRRDVETLSGVAAVFDSVGPLRVRRDVRAFFQGNRFLLETLVHRISSLVPDGPVTDLYAGVGLFGLSLAAGGIADVTLVEGDP